MGGCGKYTYKSGDFKSGDIVLEALQIRLKIVSELVCESICDRQIEGLEF